MSPFGSRRGAFCVAAGAAILASNNNMLMALAFSSPSPSQHHQARSWHRPNYHYDRLAANAVPSNRINDMFIRSTAKHPFITTSPLFMSTSSDVKFEKVDEDDDQVIAFMDISGEKGIDCYVDSYATVDGVEYTIGCPCDYAVALCYFEGEDEQLVPIELDDPLMDEIFPIAEGIIEDEFGEELVLLRTPQTLTLVGELEESEMNEDDGYDGDEDEDDDDGMDVDESEEEVEILVSFEENGQEYHLVRLLDPVLLVGKVGNENTRILLTPEESDIVMPKLESLFMNYQEERDEQ
ncbi:hypothetical protein ACHAWU_009520 [Discostella pseudostelligera]|uniref:Uncharacterized protein n=1 Tax=Discostella pseudostelligera TaxID=259834 RepID=A0ABD3MD48_9STRA